MKRTRRQTSSERRAKREKQPAIELFNKLFLQAIHKLDACSFQCNGEFLIDKNSEHSLWDLINRLNNRWRHFCDRARNNPKKRLEFKIGFFSEKFSEHISRMKKQAWMKYMSVLLWEKYGLEPSFENIDLEKYYREDFLHEDAAIKIVLSECTP